MRAAEPLETAVGEAFHDSAPKPRSLSKASPIRPSTQRGFHNPAALLKPFQPIVVPIDGFSARF